MSDRGSSGGADSPRTARSHASRLSRTIKPVLETRSYLRFLLRDYVRVREFGARSHVLLAGLWPPGIRLDPGLTAFLTQQVQAWAIELSDRLAPVLENGWIHLTPRQYNLLALLKRLCDRLRAFDFSRLSLRDRHLVDRLRRVESLFLMLQYNPDTLGVILSALRVYHEKQREGKEQLDASQALVIRLLTEDCTLPSFPHCLLGFNMFKHRRFLGMADLVRPGLGEMVDVIGFDCDPRVQDRIDAYVADALSSLQELHDQLLEARRVNRYIARDDQERPVTAALWKVYRAGETRQPVDFDADQENLVPFLSRLVRGFDRTFAPMLSGTCQLSESGRASIFSRSFFELELTRLRTLAGRLEKDVFRLTRFPLDRYLRLRRSRQEALGSEAEATDLINETVGCLVDIGQTMARVLSLRSQAPPGPGPGPEEPLEPVVLQGKPFTLPHENEHLRAIPGLAGRTVAEALGEGIAVCFTAGMLFQDDFISLFVGKEKKLDGDLRQRMEQVRHLLLPERYRDLASRFEQTGSAALASGMGR